MKPVLALSLAPLGAGWAFGRPGAEKPLSGVLTFGSPSNIEDEVWRNAQTKIYQAIDAHKPEIIAISAVALIASDAERLRDLQVVARTVVKGILPGVAKRVSFGEAIGTYTGQASLNAAEAVRAVKQESRRRLWVSMDDLVTERCMALAVWTHMAAQQLPELAFHQTKRRSA
jgi:hypothetical protein